MTLVKFNRRPVESRLNNWVDNFFNDTPGFFKSDFYGVDKNYLQPVNIKETEKDYQLEVVAPGFDKADFKVNIDQNLLTVAAEKKVEATDEKEADKNEKQIRREYSFKSFKRTFTIDEQIEANGIDASYVNGILTLNLPKKEEVKEAAKEIKIK